MSSAPPAPLEPAPSEPEPNASEIEPPAAPEPEPLLHAPATNAELPPEGAYFASRDADRRRPKNRVLEIFFEDGNVERHRGSWRLVCRLDAAGVAEAKAAIRTIEAMERARLALAAVLERSCPEP